MSIYNFTDGVWFTLSAKLSAGMDLFYAVALAIIFLISLYWYARLAYKYWEKLGVSSPPAIYPFGTQMPLLLGIFHDVEIERYKKYGQIYGYYEGLRPALTVADPELLRNIYVKDFQVFSNRRSFTFGDPITDNMVQVLEGEKWKRVRSIITPAFSTGRIKKMTSIFLDSAKTLENNFLQTMAAKTPVDAKRFYGAFTMDVIASSAFATKVDSHNDPDNKFVSVARRVFTRGINWRFIMFFTFPSLMRLLKISAFAPNSVSFFKNATLEIIKQRKITGKKRNDFLQLLLDAQEYSEEDNNQKEEENGDILTPEKLAVRKGLSNDELIAQCVIFFLAGYDTTASTLSFATFELARNPKCQERMIQEIHQAIAKHEGELSYDAVQSMNYLDNVISETLRMHPPAVRTERRADEDYELGDTGIVVKKGMMVGTPVYAMHYDSQYFPEPHTFNPDRFASDVKSQIPAYAYMPFGAGPRNCLGMRFALMEIKICLAHTFSKFKVKLHPQMKLPLQYYKGQGLLQPKEILLEFNKQ